MISQNILHLIHVDKNFKMKDLRNDEVILIESLNRSISFLLLY